MASVLSTYCSPGGPGMIATSSWSSSPAGGAGGAKNRAMRSNSPSLGAAIAAGPREFRLAQGPRDPVQHAVHHARLLAREEGVRDLDVLVHRDPRGHVAAREKLVSSGAQDRAQHALEPCQRPIRLQNRRHDTVHGLAPPPAAFDY